MLTYSCTNFTGLVAIFTKEIRITINACLVNLIEGNHIGRNKPILFQLCGRLPQHGRLAVQRGLEAADEAVRGDEAQEPQRPQRRGARLRHLH